MSDISSNPTQSKNSLSEIAAGVHKAGLSNRAGLLGSTADLTQSTQPQEVGASTSGAGAVEWRDDGAKINSGTASGEHAGVWVMKKPEYTWKGDLVIGVAYQHYKKFGDSTADYPVIGFYQGSSPTTGSGDYVVFNPAAGNNTDGNVQARDGFNNEVQTATLSWPSDLLHLHYYEIAFIGSNNGDAEFRIDKSYLSGDPADATISNHGARLGSAGAQQPFGVGIEGSNSTSGQVLNMRAVYLPE